MKIILQRVKHAQITVNKKSIASINQGLLLFVGVGKEDNEKNADYLIEKCLKLRIFNDEDGKMNHSITDINGDILVVSQFTLYGDVQKGTRPSFSSAAQPEDAKKTYDYMVQKFKEKHPQTQSGQFAADMKVELLNDGPVTLIIEK